MDKITVDNLSPTNFIIESFSTPLKLEILVKYLRENDNYIQINVYNII